MKTGKPARSGARSAALKVVRRAANIITAAGHKPQVLLILGSGLGAVAKLIKRPTVIPYAKLPGFPPSTVKSHAGKLVLGTLHGQDIAIMQGRFHLYEGHMPQAMLAPIHALRLAGCATMIVTGATGSLRASLPGGSLMLIRDHINGMGRNPLVGPNDEQLGPRFPDMTDVYDAALRVRMKACAKRLRLRLHEGVYFATLGPSFETPAEIRGMARLGGHCVGMSVVPEVIVARHAGMRIVGLAVVTNLAAGLSANPMSMDEVLEGAKDAEQKLTHLLDAFLAPTPETLSGA